MSNAELNALLAKQAITEVIYRYSRGLDRMDKAMAYSVFHDDCTAVYHDDIYNGTGHGFVDWVWQAHEGMTHHSHQMNNILIELDGSDDPQSATSETYATVTLLSQPDENGKQTVMTAFTRYLDKWSKRNGNWAIAGRVHVLDIQTADGVAVAGGKASQRNSDDPSFAILGS